MKIINKNKECNHKNKIIKPVFSVVTIEQLVDYCPNCGKTENLRCEN